MLMIVQRKLSTLCVRTEHLISIRVSEYLLKTVLAKRTLLRDLIKRVLKTVLAKRTLRRDLIKRVTPMGHRLRLNQWRPLPRNYEIYLTSIQTILINAQVLSITRKA